MSRRKHERRTAREAALSLLYSSDIAESDIEQIIEEGRYPADDLHLSDFAEQLAYGVADNLAEIDARLAETSENWALDRMPVVDRAVLRLAVYEMLFVSDVPISVSINEAVELAKAYGGEDDSPRFVNGVLGRIARAMEPADSPSVADPDDVAAAPDDVAAAPDDVRERDAAQPAAPAGDAR